MIELNRLSVEKGIKGRLHTLLQNWQNNPFCWTAGVPSLPVAIDQALPGMEYNANILLSMIFQYSFGRNRCRIWLNCPTFIWLYCLAITPDYSQRRKN